MTGQFCVIYCHWP